MAEFQPVTVRTLRHSCINAMDDNSMKYVYLFNKTTHILQQSQIDPESHSLRSEVSSSRCGATTTCRESWWWERLLHILYPWLSSSSSSSSSPAASRFRWPTVRCAADPRLSLVCMQQTCGYVLLSERWREEAATASSNRSLQLAARELSTAADRPPLLSQPPSLQRDSARDGQVRQVRHWRCCRWCLWIYLQMTVWCQQQPPGNPDPPNWTPEEPMQETPSCAPSLRQAPERSTHTSINNHKHSKAALCRAHATHPQQHVSTVFLINAVGFFQASDVNRHPIGGHDRKPAGLFSLWRTAQISSLSITY